jgi:hypothetical protein
MMTARYPVLKLYGLPSPRVAFSGKKNGMRVLNMLFMRKKPFADSVVMLLLLFSELSEI